MNRFWFALWVGDAIRGTGAVEAASLPEALRVVSQRGVPKAGDRLEIGIDGFPPARYVCVFEDFDTPLRWRLTNARAA